MMFTKIFVIVYKPMQRSVTSENEGTLVPANEMIAIGSEISLFRIHLDETCRALHVEHVHDCILIMIVTVNPMLITSVMVHSTRGNYFAQSSDNLFIRQDNTTAKRPPARGSSPPSYHKTDSLFAGYRTVYKTGQKKKFGKETCVLMLGAPA